MVFVTMGYKHSSYSVFILKNIGEIGNDIINAGGFFIGEGHSAVDYYHFPRIFIKCYIFTYLTKSAKRDDMHFLRFCFFARFLFSKTLRRFRLFGGTDGFCRVLLPYIGFFGTAAGILAFII